MAHPPPLSELAHARAPRWPVALAWLMAVAATVGVFALYAVFVRSRTGQLVDNAAYVGAKRGQGQLWDSAQQVLDLVSVPSIVLVIVASMLIAALRRRWMQAVQVAVLVAGANLTTEVLKTAVFVRPDLHVGYPNGNALPSGHTTVAASISAALLFVVPRRARPWAAVLGAVYTVLTGVATMVKQWHRPSDVVAAVLVVLAWSGMACALSAWGKPEVLPGTPRPLPGTGGSAVAAALLVLAALGAGAGASVALTRIWRVASSSMTSAQLLTAYIGGALGVIAVTSLAFALLLAVRQAVGHARLGPRRGSAVQGAAPTA
jgi:membrane-associated phospholipid phosphatase